LTKRSPRRWIVPVYFVLLALSVPWYWPAGDLRHFLGIPFWALAALGGVFATAVFTAWIYLHRSDDEPS
jgi:hypothetical protein